MAARRLAECGAQVAAVLLEGEPATDNARVMLAELDGTSVKVLRMEEASGYLLPMLQASDFVIDAVYGVGFRGQCAAAFGGDFPRCLVVSRCDGVHRYAERRGLRHGRCGRPLRDS